MRWTLILLALPLHAATYYVATTGNNSNTCAQAQTSTTPKLTVSQGVACAVAGDTVSIAGGTYGNEGNISDGTGGSVGYHPAVDLTAAGTASARITVRGTDPNNRPILDCGTTASAFGCDMYFWLENSAAYWTFQYLVVRRGAFGAINTNTGSHVQVLNCDLGPVGGWNYTGNIGMSAIGTGAATDWTVNASTIHDVGRTGPTNLDHGFYTHTNGMTVTNNLFYNNSHGWHIQMADQTQNWLISNNVFAFATTGQGAIMFWNVNTNITLRNNIFFNQSGAAMTSFTATITNCIFDHNLIFPTQGTGVSQCTATNGVTGDPNFTNTTTAPYDFHVSPPSPAIDAGTTVAQVTTDFAGTARPQPPGGAYDIGAYEYVPTTPCSIAPTVLGPWTVSQVISQVLTASGTCGTTAWTLTGSWPPGLSGCSSGAATTCTVTGTISGLVRIVPHNALLAWQDTVNPSGTSYNAYRATGRCVSPSTFSQIASGLSVLTYTDLSVAPGSYCYQVTAVAGGLESNPSNAVDASVPSAYAPVVAYGTASNTYAITVNPTPAVTITALPAGVAGVAYSQQVPTTGGSGAVSCAMSSGSLPLGLTLSSGCLVSGTPATAGSSTFSVQTMDANSVATTSPLTMAVSSTAPTSGITVSGGTTCGACVF